MPGRRTVARIAALGVAPLALSLVNVNTAQAHGSMTDPVSRVSACFAEGPENPQSAACKAAVKSSGTQAFYDWNEVNIPDAAGRHQQIIPDGKLCSAGRDKYKGLDLPRTDWPSSKMSAGEHAFSYKATAPHKGSFELYITKAGYDASEPLKWSDLESKPFAKVSDPQLQGGEYKFKGEVPKRTGRHLIYSIWQRSDSPEAFYTCSDVTFGGSNGAATRGTDTGPKRAPAAPSDSQIAGNAGKSTVSHHGHGGPAKSGTDGKAGTHSSHSHDTTWPKSSGNARQQGAEAQSRLAETGDDGSTRLIAVAGTGVLLLGSALTFAAARRRTAGRRQD
ncbi:lytic polysaccharide monooxygenase auxiliary activity family 9 protein [Streptomyces albidus (ex Kaewkla and Franco 2022)]|uniref:lytic polysaccharide monooxygenase auxiliary activity family 9 protein n=1 Tax=Streptomyces albidus (ex Kaewkla and Franco 2022) TaxID=722709 RepID=UPI0015EF1781|nr:lytic polysaccharide monooxygenase [Streptomyces albidus (ex Kaewkla and Franco 2022)]